MRLVALRALVRTLRPARQETSIPLAYLTQLLLFEDDSDCCNFLLHCGMPVEEGRGGMVVRLAGQDVDAALPRNENDNVRLTSSNPNPHPGLSPLTPCLFCSEDHNVPMHFALLLWRDL